MDTRTRTEDGLNLPNFSTHPVAVPAPANLSLAIDLDDAVALELTEKEKQRYRSNRDYLSRRTTLAAFQDDDEMAPTKKTRKQKQREVFAAKEGDYTTPVVILILLDIQDKLNAHVAALAKTNPQKASEFAETVEIIKVTIAIFAKSDTIMQGYMWDKTGYLGVLKQRAKAKTQQSGVQVNMFEHLTQLVQLVERVKISLDMVPLIRELSMWLFGMYWNDAAALDAQGKLDKTTDEPIKEEHQDKESGQKIMVFPLVNTKDRVVCYRQFGFRLLDVTYNHFLVSRKLEEKCRACELEHGIVQEPVKVLPPAVAVKSEAASNDFSTKLVPSSNPGRTDIVVRINTANFPDQSAAAAKRALMAMFRNPLGALLSYRIYAPIHLRIREFSDRLAVFVLSDEMRTMLAGTKASALRVLKDYKAKKSALFNTIIWAVSAGTQDNKNLALVDKAHKAIEATNRYEDIIAAMVELREGAVDNQSTNIAVDVTRFLLNQIEMIRTSEAATGPGIDFADPLVMTDDQNRHIQTMVFNISDEHCEIADTICKAFHSIVANPLGFALAQCNLEDDERILYFKNKITVYGFTPVQEAEYAEFYEQTKEVVLQYIDPAALSYVNIGHYFERGTLPRLLEKYLEKTHAKDADNLLAILTKPEVPLAVKILKTIEIYEIVKDKYSTTLGPALKTFLLGYMSWLTPYIPTKRPTLDARIEKRPDSSFGF